MSYLGDGDGQSNSFPMGPSPNEESGVGKSSDKPPRAVNRPSELRPPNSALPGDGSARFGMLKDPPPALRACTSLF